MTLTIKVHVEDSNGETRKVTAQNAAKYVRTLLALCMRGTDVRHEEIQSLEAHLYGDDPACSILDVEAGGLKIEV